MGVAWHQVYHRYHGDQAQEASNQRIANARGKGRVADFLPGLLFTERPWRNTSFRFVRWVRRVDLF